MFSYAYCLHICTLIYTRYRLACRSFVDDDVLYSRCLNRRESPQASCTYRDSRISCRFVGRYIIIKRDLTKFIRVVVYSCWWLAFSRLNVDDDECYFTDWDKLLPTSWLTLPMPVCLNICLSDLWSSSAPPVNTCVLERAPHVGFTWRKGYGHVSPCVDWAYLSKSRLDPWVTVHFCKLKRDVFRRVHRVAWRWSIWSRRTHLSINFQ